MGASRKHQGEIDRVLKNVQERLDVFDSLWDKVYDTENSNRKEKLVTDLRKEIKKLHKYRDLITSWIHSSDFHHDPKVSPLYKQALIDTRNRINRELEDFKACEKDTKTKAFSKQALALNPKTGPKERAKSEARAWLNNVVADLGSQIDTFEAEMEGLLLQKRKTRPPRLTHLEASIKRHKAHVMKLELILRLLDNDEVTPEEVNDIKDFLDDYVERNQEDFEDFNDVDDLYSSLRLDKVALEKLVGGQGPPSLVRSAQLHSSKNSLSASASRITNSAASESDVLLGHIIKTDTLRAIKSKDVQQGRELGSGTFGTVYQGKWRGMNVAIKRMKSSGSGGDSTEAAQRRLGFLKEAQILSNLSHRNVVAFYGLIQDGPEGTLATVTEYLKDGSLRDVLVSNSKHFGRYQRLLIATDVAVGMEYLHRQKVVHFDLKSANIFVNMANPSRPICKVGDLGLSKMKQDLIVSSGARGTLPWMAPELLNGKTSNQVSEKIDVYSFGIVLWEILTAEVPYRSMDHKAIIGGVVDNKLRPPLSSSVDPDWKELMQKCWAADPWARPSFTEVANSLRSMVTMEEEQVEPREKKEVKHTKGWVRTKNAIPPLRVSYKDSNSIDGEKKQIIEAMPKGLDLGLQKNEDPGKEIKQRDLYEKASVSDVYGVRASNPSYVHGGNKQHDLHKRESASNVYGVRASGSSIIYGRNKQDDLHKRESASNVYGARASGSSIIYGRNKQDDLHKRESASNVFALQATKSFDIHGLDKQADGCKKDSPSNIHEIGASGAFDIHGGDKQGDHHKKDSPSTIHGIGASGSFDVHGRN